MACSSDLDNNSSIFQGNEIESGGEFSVCTQSNVKVVKVVPLPHARSEVWSYFGFIADDDGEITDKKKTICRICATTLCYSGNTTNLFTHLKAMHPQVNPTKLAPTNKTPKTGKKSNKRKFFDADFEADSETSLIPFDNMNSNYIVRNLSITSPTIPSELDNHESSSIIRSTSLNVNSISTNNHPQLTTTSSTTNTAAQNNLLKSNINNNKQNSTTTTTKTTTIALNDHHHKLNQSIHNQSDQQLNELTQHTTNDHEQITDSIINLIVRDCRPIDLVTGKHFTKMIKLLAPNYKIPDFNELEQLVKKKYIEVRREMILKSMDDE